MLRDSPLEQHGITADPEIGPVSFQRGVVLDPISRPLLFTADTTAEHPPADYVSFMIPVFSDRLVEAFGRCGVDNLQIFPAELHNPTTGERWMNYKAVNVTGLVSCLAIDASHAEPDLPPLYSFDLADLVIEESRARNMPLFRLAESPSVLLVRSDIGDQIMDWQPSFRGLEFRDVGSV